MGRCFICTSHYTHLPPSYRAIRSRFTEDILFRCWGRVHKPTDIQQQYDAPNGTSLMHVPSTLHYQIIRRRTQIDVLVYMHTQTHTCVYNQHIPAKHHRLLPITIMSMSQPRNLSIFATVMASVCNTAFDSLAHLDEIQHWYFRSAE